MRRAHTRRRTRTRQAHFRDVVTGFTEYAKDTEREIARREAAIRPADVARVPALANRAAAMRACVEANQTVLDAVCEPYMDHVKAHRRDHHISHSAVFSPPHRMSKVRTTLHQIVREWSAEGAAERACAFAPLLQALEANVAKPARVAVPGCGLGRLVVEVCALGYAAEGSEFSYEMLLTGDWIMHRMSMAMTVHPWVDQASNVRAFEATARAVRFPDRWMNEVVEDDQSGMGTMRINAGEFTHVYANVPAADRFGAVVCCFFLDTAPNLSEYMEVIKAMLLPGGLLLSFGPLQWHWQPPFGANARSVDDERFAHSLELTLEDVVALIASHGFDVQAPAIHPGVRYNDNAASLQHNVFDCALIVARKL